MQFLCSTNAGGQASSSTAKIDTSIGSSLEAGDDQSLSLREICNSLDSATSVEGGPSQAQSMANINIQIREDIVTKTVEHFGDQLRSIDSIHTLRVGFININRIPQSAEHPKNKLIFNSINIKQIEILGETMEIKLS